jgi:hypothetical protein
MYLVIAITVIVGSSVVFGPIVALRWFIPWTFIGLDYLQRALGPQPVLGWLITGAVLVVGWGSFAMALRLVRRFAQRLPKQRSARPG